MTKIALVVLVATFFNGLFWLVSTESGPYEMTMETIEPRSDGSDYLDWSAEIRKVEISKSPKITEKRLWMTMNFKKPAGPMAARIKVWSDKSGKSKRGDWNEEASMDVKNICEAPFGLENFMNCLSPKANFNKDKDKCGFLDKKIELMNWTMNNDLHDAFSELTYNHYKIGVLLTCAVDPVSNQVDYEKPMACFNVTGDVKKPHKKKNCKNDEDCGKKKKKKDEKDENEV